MYNVDSGETPVAPTGPVDPVEPAGPVDPVAPYGPVAPVAPIGPVNPDVIAVTILDCRVGPSCII